MKNFWKRVPLQNWESLSEKIKNYILNETDVLTRGLFFNDLDYDKFNICVPELREEFRKLDLELNGCFAVVNWSSETMGIHSDLEDTNSTRINLPIMNCNGTSTVFYKADRNESQILEYPGGFPYYLYDPTKCVEVDRVELNQPTALDIWSPHKVIVPDNATVPRISITCGFDRDPVELLL